MRPLTGEALLAGAEAALAVLRRVRESLDALNVFPVADHDTGTNMALTLEAAVAEARGVPAELNDVSHALARGAFRSARGSSGVLLAEFLRGLAEGFAGVTAAGAHVIRDALRRAAHRARRAVAHPVEGTFLTVADAAAAGAEGATAPEALRGATAAARVALAHTPDQLEVLRTAGVVDAGAAGLVVFLQALATAMEPGAEEPLPLAAPATAAAPAAPQAVRPVYCTQVVVRAGHAAVSPAALRHLGDAVIVAEQEGLVRIHLHTASPEVAVRELGALGAVEEFTVTRVRSA
ncbi:MAG: DAK2 domain-containing protein [Armatimonadota bacterium]|nr:DAK2 domain-containing protein [Armatimonadota bacterium]MDR7401222.1 DAK2 domain-containing protein [Armatimonadota bacterium]MDR7403019.1 DAK2 domain-containing protein [Armatimonadota bacterium]MDR7437720.1 DAK2 domain-containing protein [Armatimonadota bacterium]MDR7471875.1 DAK2 domain-containing protein [Armatimonadota bacterium]